MSVRIVPGQEIVIYPPNPGETDDLCGKPCGHISCVLASQDAEKLCPHCQQPLGLGCVQRVEWYEPTKIVWSNLQQKTITLPAEPKLTMMHLACWEARYAAVEDPNLTEDSPALS